MNLLKNTLCILFGATFLSAQAGHYLGKGIDALRNGDEEEAQKYFKQDLQEDPQNGFDYLYLGRIFSHSNENSNYPLAFKCYYLAEKFLPASNKEDRAYLHFWRSYLYEVMEDTTKMVKEINKAIALQPKETDFLNQRAWIYYMQDNYKGAEADLKKVISIDKKNALGYRHYGFVLYAQKQYDQAIEKFKKTIELDTDSTYYSARTGLGLCYKQKKDYAKMAEEFANAIETDGWDQIDTEMGKLTPEELSYMHPALEAKKKEHPKDVIWPFADGICSMNEHKYIESLKSLNEALIIEDNPYIYSHKAQVLRRLGQNNEALKACMKGLEIDSSNSALLDTRTMIHCYEKGNTKKAKAAADTMLSRAPNKVRSYTVMGSAYSKAREYDNAAKWFQKSYILGDGENLFPLYARASCFLRAGNKELAKKHFEEYLEKDTSATSSRYGYANAHLGKYEKVRQCIDSLQAKINTNNEFDNYYDIACMYNIMGEKSKSVENLRLFFEKEGPDYSRAEDDEDFESIRQTAEYKAVIEEAKKKAAEIAKIIAGMNKDAK